MDENLCGFVTVDSFVFLLTVYRPFTTNGTIPPTISANGFAFCIFV